MRMVDEGLLFTFINVRVENGSLVKLEIWKAYFLTNKKGCHMPWEVEKKLNQGHEKV